LNVTVFNCSPKMDNGNTALILSPFLESMKEAGAEVNLFYTKKLKINPCQGCYTCWLKTPGVCFQKDDMQMLHPKLRDADIWVFATPVYADCMTGPMKNLFDRLLPIVYPFFELRDGHCRHPLREGYKPGKVALVSTCGSWEIDNFDPLLIHIRTMCKSLQREFAGALLRPHGEAVKPMIELRMPLDDIFSAAKMAGFQLVRDGKMSTETLNVVSRELLPLEMFVQLANQSFQQQLDALQKPMPTEK
jgi:multimeric flavodoxin WrbA